MTKKELWIITTEGQTTKTEIAEVPPLDALQTIVGGLIQVVPQWTTLNGLPCIAVCNEDGKSLGLPVNDQATALWYSEYRGHDNLVGPVAVITGDLEFLSQF